MTNRADQIPGYSSPPCFTHELEHGEQGYAPVDPIQSVDVARWRKAERAWLIAARLALSFDERKRASKTISDELDNLIDFTPQSVVSIYWPMQGEPNLCAWMKTVFAKGARVALPVVVAKQRPLVFREWTPTCRMQRGVWNIPIPADGAELSPSVVIAPLVGYDPDGYRLGYGGGFFDRTLAALPTIPKIIGVGHSCTAISTIFPQPYDIPMDVIVTENGQMVVPK